MKGLSHSKKAMENREQCVEINLIEEEGEIVVTLKKSKENFRELVEKEQEQWDKELM